MTQEAVNNGIVIYELGIDRKLVEDTQCILFITPELMAVLTSPVIQQKTKNNVIDRIFSEQDKEHMLMTRFIKKMCQIGAIREIDDIFQSYYLYWDEKNNISRASCVFAKEPSKPTLDRIKSFLETKYSGKQINITYTVDSSILGGAIVRIGHEEYDWSFEGRIRQLENVITA